jgi:hypothetical protein
MHLHVCWTLVTVAPLRSRTENVLASICPPESALSTPFHTIPARVHKRHGRACGVALPPRPVLVQHCEGCGLRARANAE